MAVTMTQIAKEVGVSVAVVSRLLREDPTLSVSAQRKQEILDAVERAGGIEIKSRKRQQTKVILVPIPDTHTPTWLEHNTLTGERWGMFKKTIEAAGFALHLSLFSTAKQHEAIKNIVTDRKQADGMLLLSCQATAQDASLLWANAFPHVSFQLRDEQLGLNTVRANLDDGLRLGIRHLHELGHRRIAYVGSRCAQNYPQIVAAMAICQLPIDQTLDCTITPLLPEADQAAYYDHTYAHARQWLTQRWPGSGITAIAGQDDRCASAFIQAMVDMGMTPGKEISVLGCGNQLPKDIHPDAAPACGITTIDNPFGRVGRRAAELLLNQVLHQQHHIVHERIPTQLIVRQSTGPALHGGS